MSEISDYFLEKAEELKEMPIEIVRKSKEISIQCGVDHYNYGKLILREKPGKHQLAFIKYQLDGQLSWDFDNDKPGLEILGIIREGILTKVYAPWYDEEEINTGDDYKKAIDFVFETFEIGHEILEKDLAKTREKAAQRDEEIIRGWHKRN